VIVGRVISCGIVPAVSGRSGTVSWLSGSVSIGARGERGRGGGGGIRWLCAIRLSVIAGNDSQTAISRATSVTIGLIKMVITTFNIKKFLLFVETRRANKSHYGTYHILTATNTETIVSRFDDGHKIVVSLARSANRFAISLFSEPMMSIYTNNIFFSGSNNK
jgi:hypothetical protein